MDIYGVVDKWDLEQEPLNLRRYSRQNLKLLCEDVEYCYTEPPDPMLGRAHLGITESVRLMETAIHLHTISLPLVLFEQLWIPDPLYSLLATSASKAWAISPDSGSRYFTKSPGPYVHWNSYWTTRIAERVDFLERSLPPIIGKLMQLKPLVSAGAVCVFPWELFVLLDKRDLRKLVHDLSVQPLVKQIGERYHQDRYSLGPRIGAIGAAASSDIPHLKVRKGDPIWLADKTQIVWCGLTNALLTAELTATFHPRLAGDRLVHDFIRTGGDLTPQEDLLIGGLKLPNLTEALWPDIVAIRNGSEALAELRSILTKATFISDTHGEELIRNALLEAARRIAADRALTKQTQGGMLEASIAGLIASASTLMTGGTLALSGLVGAATLATPLLVKIIHGRFSRHSKELKRNVDLLVRIANRIA